MSNTSDQAYTWTPVSWNWPSITTATGGNYPIIAGGADDPASDDPGDSTDGDTSDATGGDTPDASEGKTFTQEDVNKLISRETAKAQRGKIDPKELGFDSLKDMKEFFDTAKQQTDDAKSEAEKAIEQARKEAAKQARDEILSVANSRVIKAEFLVAAKENGVRYTTDAFALAQTLELWKDVDITEDGVVHGLDEEFFKELQKAKPFLFEPEGEGGAPDIGAGRRGGSSPKDKEAETVKLFPALRNR